jgi:VWFA-related protein
MNQNASGLLSGKPGFRSFWAVCSTGLALCLGTTPLHAQEQPPIQVFSDVVDVRVVNVEVVVTDKAGNRITDLGRSDFRLEVDGEEQPIDYFTKVVDGQALGGADGESTVPSLVAGKSVPTNYLVFIDDYFTLERDRDRVLDAIEQQLSQIRPGDKVAIVAFDGKKVDMISSWSEFQGEIARAFRDARLRKTYGLKQRTSLITNDRERRERREMRLLSLERSGNPDPNEGSFLRTSLDPAERAYVDGLTTEVERGVMAAVSALRTFANPPGRKVMLLLNGGWPFSPAEYVINDFSSRPVDTFMSGAVDGSYKARERLYGPLTDTANLLGYTLYPIDVAGNYREATGDASNSGTDLTIGISRTELNPVGAISRETDIHSGLDHLADATGGQALINAERDDALARVIDDTRSYYWLGFQPERREDDQVHDIRVTIVGRKDLQVRARENFQDLSRSSQVSMVVESALLLGNPPTNKPLATTFGRPSKSRRKIEVPLEVRIPMSEITLLPTNGRYVNELEVRVTVMDLDGNRSEMSIEKIEINGAEPPEAGQYFTYQTVLELKKRSHRVVVAVYDPISGAILSSTGDLEL